MKQASEAIAERFPAREVDVTVGVESRGFILGTLMANKYGIGFVMARKAGKTPGQVRSVEYSLEYGTDSLQMGANSIKAGQRVLICDDLLATGGTAKAAASLVEACGGTVCGMAFIMELTELGGRDTIDAYNIFSLVTF